MQNQKNMGKIWKNPSKKEDKHPDLKGFIWIDGVKFDLGGWLRQEDDGRTHYSLSARQYENPDNGGVTKTLGKGANRVPSDGYSSAHDLNDAIPF
jgi:hypothetical protein